MSVATAFCADGQAPACCTKLSTVSVFVCGRSVVPLFGEGIISDITSGIFNLYVLEMLIAFQQISFW